MRRRVIGRCRGRCWSYLTSWTASALTVTSRSEARQVFLLHLAVSFDLFPAQVIAATNRVDTLDPALLRSGGEGEGGGVGRSGKGQ